VSPFDVYSIPVTPFIRLGVVHRLSLRGTRTPNSNLIKSSPALFSTKAESFLAGSNSVYVDQMYSAWKKDPKSVHVSWASFFTNQDAGLSSTESMTIPEEAHLSNAAARSASSSSNFSDSLGISFLIRAYQVRGHEVANLDPLGMNAFRDPAGPPAELDYKYHGFTEADLDRKLNLGGNTGGHVGFIERVGTADVTLRQVIEQLKKTYCGGIGVEYMHISSREKCNWIRSKVEQPEWMKFSHEKVLLIFKRLCFADRFERFLANKFNTAKRFGLEGAESFIPGLINLIDRGTALGIESFVFGMPHRGRLNVLANVMRKPMPLIFKEFQGNHYNLEEYMQSAFSYSSDVKYHLGTSADHVYPDGRKVRLSLTPNPSHLEAVNPVAAGKTRAKQFLSGNREEDKKKHMCVLLHGDAAFAGQGVVYESMQLAKVPDFDIGGTVHVIVNNQVGFTTNPENSRSTMYASDLGKAFGCPIFHCNGDDPLAVVAAFEMAVEWRQTYGTDCIIDVISYRRHGHNELDQPAFTQPLMYKKIDALPPSIEIFEKQILAEKLAEAQELNDIKQSVEATLASEFEASKTWPNPKDSDWLTTKWAGFKSPRQQSRIRETGYDTEKLRTIGLSITQMEANFTLHKQLEKIVAARRQTIVEGKGIDWGTAEALAFGSLLLEGNHVRLTGQDVQRGTFSHRHAVLVDQATGNTYTPLNHLAKIKSSNATTESAFESTQAEFTCRNSILSEFAVLGFEHGYSLENPNLLVLWEAQFGDFVNGAQIMIDQFITSGEDKWLRQCGLVMLLPHGYDGQGAEHSSSRMERFLQQVDEDSETVPEMKRGERMQIQTTNFQVVNCTTPANYFHVLRRQIHRDFRKPLIVISPKSLLRDKRCTSTLEEMSVSTSFHRVYGEANPEIKKQPEKVRRVIFCSGKVYYDLVARRTESKIDDVAIVRLEQIAPFPFDKVAKQAALYSNAEVVWVQEEPQNMGAWTYVDRRIATSTRVLNGNQKLPRYIGRPSNAATATGLGLKAHTAELNLFLDAAFAL
jgi:2-oxoglutarate dehydrogenase E1 component